MVSVVDWLLERAEHVEASTAEYSAISARALREAAEDLRAQSAPADAVP